MAEQDTSLSFQQLSVIDLLKSHIQSQKDAIKTLENKAQHNFDIINIIAAIVAALNLDLGDTYNVRQILSERALSDFCRICSCRGSVISGTNALNAGNRTHDGIIEKRSRLVKLRPGTPLCKTRYFDEIISANL